MLKYIKVKNFFSAGEEQEMSFEINPKDLLNNSAKQIALSDEAKSVMHLNLVNCIIGSNASGKTTILKAISFLTWFMLRGYESAQTKVPSVTHMLKKNEPTKIEIGFLDNGIFYEYLIEFSSDEILHESLKKRVQRETRIFELTRKNGKTNIKTKLKINETDKERFAKLKHVPLLSALMSTLYISDISFFKNIVINVGPFGMDPHDPIGNFLNISQILHSDEVLRQDVLNFSKKIDLGISELGFKSAIVRTTPFSNTGEIKAEDKKWLLKCLHKSKKGSFDLDLILESNGTQQSYYLLAQILPVLKSGGLVVLDEIETGLHPYIVRKIIALFEDEKTNPNNAQIIFSTHQHPLLIDRTKTQIFLTEKNDQNLETEIYRLDEVNGVRNDENYYQKYIAGAYGAIPNIDWL